MARVTYSPNSLVKPKKAPAAPSVPPVNVRQPMTGNVPVPPVRPPVTPVDPRTKPIPTGQTLLPKPGQYVPPPTMAPFPADPTKDPRFYPVPPGGPPVNTNASNPPGDPRLNPALTPRLPGVPPVQYAPGGRPDHTVINQIRRNETPEERLVRLQGMQDAGNPKLQDDVRIQGLKNQINQGLLEEGVKFKNQAGRNQPKVQLDDDPSTWTSEQRAELALPRGMDTMFYDNPKGDAQVKTAQQQKDKLAAGATTPPVTTPKKTAGQQTTPTTKPTSEERQATRADEDLADRVKRLEAKLASSTNPEQKKKLRQRIADLKKRIAAGDTKGRSESQPGSPQRPYRNREVTYAPLREGGKIRI